MRNLVFFLEEPSTKEMLKGLLPRLIYNIEIHYLVFQGKQDLEKNLKLKLSGWRKPESLFVVIRDQDSGDCFAVKEKLVGICQETKKMALVRVACRELESFYLGDLAAVEQGLNIRGLGDQQSKKKFRNPDNLQNPAEELYKLTRNQYSKVAGSQAIAAHLDLNNNKSKSFKALVTGIQKLLTE